jgi:hypothetical protein
MASNSGVVMVTLKSIGGSTSCSSRSPTSPCPVYSAPKTNGNGAGMVMLPRSLHLSCSPTSRSSGRSASPCQTSSRYPSRYLQSQPRCNLMYFPVLLSVVSEKTGYPSEMLELDMDMEADLGIDSIKRVEILGAMRTHFPDFPKLSPKHLPKCARWRR